MSMPGIDDAVETGAYVKLGAPPAALEHAATTNASAAAATIVRNGLA
jgi:hypothetical protein